MIFTLSFTHKYKLDGATARSLSDPALFSKSESMITNETLPT
jgi:hypothetical protein